MAVSPDEYCSNDSEATLIARAIAGEPQAADELMRAYATRLERHLQHRFPKKLQHLLDVDDILQETFLQVFRDIVHFDSRGPGSFYAWIRAIAENRIVDCIREYDRKKRGGDRAKKLFSIGSVYAECELERSEPGDDSPSQGLVTEEAVRQIKSGIAELPNDQRRALELHCLEGQTLEQTAASIGRTPDAVRGLIHRAKCQLLQHLKGASR